MPRLALVLAYSTLFSHSVAAQAGCPTAQLGKPFQALLPPSQRGSEGQSLRVGVRVRVNRLEGVIRAILADTLVLEVRGANEPVRFRLADVTYLEVWQRSRTPAGRGAILGFPSGLLVGGLIGSLVQYQAYGCDTGGFGWSLRCETKRQSRTGFGMVAGATVGLAIGAALGQVIRTDVWEEIDVSPVAMSIGLGSGRPILLSLAVAF